MVLYSFGERLKNEQEVNKGIGVRDKWGTRSRWYHVTCHVCTTLTTPFQSITVPYPSDVDFVETKCDIRLLVEPFATARGPQMTG